MNNTISDNKNYSLTLIGDNILYTTYFDDAEIDLPKIEEIIDEGLHLMNHSPFYSLVDMSDVFGAMSNDAKNHVAKDKLLAELKIGEALLVNNLPMKLLIIGYLKIFKPLTNVQVFKDHKSAGNWFQEIGATSKSVEALNEFVAAKNSGLNPALVSE
jgi:hypothetical protein